MSRIAVKDGALDHLGLNAPGWYQQARINHCRRLGIPAPEWGPCTEPPIGVELHNQPEPEPAEPGGVELFRIAKLRHRLETDPPADALGFLRMCNDVLGALMDVQVHKTRIEVSPLWGTSHRLEGWTIPTWPDAGPLVRLP